MFRKTLLGLIAAAALVTTAFAPTAASASYYGYRSYYKPYAYSYNSYNYYKPHCFYKKVWNYGYVEYVKVCH